MHPKWLHLLWEEEHVPVGLWSLHIVQHGHGDEHLKLSTSHASLNLNSQAVVSCWLVPPQTTWKQSMHCIRKTSGCIRLAKGIIHMDGSTKGINLLSSWNFTKGV
ncbi:hypothetical protein VNO77_18773 [Canavalia gladiata]|uniref:Uncharacterized protein n=1 Tax=Canavalia gladiata TaxID=3824 RepID=A0AAN9LM56_CANGL